MTNSHLGSAGSREDLHAVEVIEDRTGVRCKNNQPVRYAKRRFLGKGGFAKCYEVQDMDTKELFAAKIVDKSSISKPRAHAKLRSEISIHRSLSHERVVGFHDYFEDSENVYLILELCSNQALNDFVRKRPGKRFSEPEAMFYFYELISALRYLHHRRVIHRDLKLGNLFLDAEGHLKVGDFGLAAQLTHDGEKKRTICGTPNYIAPEILEGKTGHSYEVDIWSLGVILYTMLIGRPPFETADVKTTYRRIRYNQYSIPDTVRLSDQSKDLITSILRTDPRSRASLDEILASPWFQTSRLPPPMPATIASGWSPSPRPIGSSARSETPDRVPDFARIDSPAPKFPLRDRSPDAMVQSPWGQAQNQPISAVPSKFTANCGGTTPGRNPAGPGCLTGRPPLAHRGNEENIMPAANASDRPAVCPSNINGQTLGVKSTQPLAFTGREALQGAGRSAQQSQSYTPHAAPQPGLPRAASLSHRPPSRDSPRLTASGSLPTKVVASARSGASSPRHPLQASARQQTGGAQQDSRSVRLLGQPEGTGPLFAKTTASLPRGTAAQRVPSHRPSTAACDSPRPPAFDAQATTPARAAQLQQPLVASARRKERSSSSPLLAMDGEPATPAGSASHRAPDSIRGFSSCRNSQGMYSPAEAACGPGPADSQAAVLPSDMPELWVTKWVDYSSKYGVGYTLSDGSMGVYFNDSTKIIMSAGGTSFDYITRRMQEKPEVRTTHTFEDYPEDLKKKVTLLRHFRNYMLTDIMAQKDGASVGESSLPPPAQNNAQKGAAANSSSPESGQVHYVKKWTRNKHAIMFQLSNKIVQIFFFDKAEAVLSSKTRMATYTDRNSQVCSYPFSNVWDVPNPELARRLRHTKDILSGWLSGRTSALGGA